METPYKSLPRSGLDYENLASKVFDEVCAAYLGEGSFSPSAAYTPECFTRDTPERCLHYRWDRLAGAFTYCIYKRGHEGRHSDGGGLEWYRIPDVVNSATPGSGWTFSKGEVPHHHFYPRYDPNRTYSYVFTSRPLQFPVDRLRVVP